MVVIYKNTKFAITKFAILYPPTDIKSFFFNSSFCLSLCMLFDDSYKTIKIPGEGIFRDKGSKFLGFSFSVRTEDEAKIYLTKIRSAHPKARHYCWALRLTKDRSVFKLNDDGEPSGSAGRPILNTLLSFDVTNVLIIVVRYFGGTLLGIPGLINAYKNTAADTLNNSTIEIRSLMDVYQFDFDYIELNSFMRVVKESEAQVLKQEFDNNCSVNLEIRKNDVGTVLSKMKSLNTLKIKFLYSI